jgi:peptidoglycan/xylan/chitin deacetylase (PgdA/CDA1 family)
MAVYAAVAAAVVLFVAAGIAAGAMLGKRSAAEPTKASGTATATPAPASSGKTTARANAVSAVATAPIAQQDASAPDPVPVADPATDQVVPVLMYHHIMPKPNNSIAITPATFERQMTWLEENGYHPVSTAQLTDFVRTGKRLPSKPVYITFDDGRSNQLTYGVPILKKHGFTATFFVVKKWVIGKSASFMHETDLKKLADDGFDVQSHTGNHVKMLRMKLKSTGTFETYAQMKTRLWPVTDGMRIWLAGITGKPVTAVAYPGGYEDKYSVQLMRESGYTTAFTTNDGVNRYGKPEPLMLKRYNAGARGLSWGSFVADFRESEKAGK